MNVPELSLAAARAGDEEALAALVRRHHARVYRYGVRACRDHFDAEDAVQEAFTALSRRPDVREGPTALSWLLTVVRNACRRLLRPFALRRRHLGDQGLEADAVAADEGASPEQLLERWRVVRAVHAAIAALPAPLREVLVLRDLEGLSAPEVAQLLDLTEEAVKSRLHRARGRLRETLRPMVDGLSG